MATDRQIAQRIQQEQWIGCASPAAAVYDAAPQPIRGASELRDGWSN
jgi:hypothetical protein